MSLSHDDSDSHPADGRAAGRTAPDGEQHPSPDQAQRPAHSTPNASGHHHHDHHNHGHHHHHGIGAHGLSDSPDTGTERRLTISVVFNLIITAAQVVGGLLAGSLALLSDALHNFSDASSLLISLVANRLSRRKPTGQMTFGYRRAEIIGAFVNLITLGIVAILILKEAVHRIVTPETVNTTILLSVASIGLLANLLTALLLRKDAANSVNIKSAYMHIVMDTLSSVAVILGALVIRFTGWTLIDPLLSVLIAGYIVYFGWSMLRSVTEILMEAVPPDLSIADVVAAVRSVESVVDVHHVHVWMINERTTALEAHVALNSTDWEKMESVKASIKTLLGSSFNIAHSTLEFEISEVPCADAELQDCF